MYNPLTFLAAVRPAAARPNFSVFPQRNCPKQWWKGGGISGSLVNICLDCENAKFESSSKTSTKEPKDFNIQWPFTSRLKPCSRAVTVKYLTCPVYRCRLICAQQGRMVRHQGDQKRGLSDSGSLGALTRVLSQAFFCTPDTLKVYIQGYQ